MQATLACVVSFWFLGFDTAGSPVLVFVIAIINAVLGVGLGLLCSAFARTEFQAVQFMPRGDRAAAAAVRHHRAARRAAGLAAMDQQCVCPPATLWKRCNRSAHAGADRHRGARHRRGDRFAVVALCLAAATLRRRTP